LKSEPTSSDALKPWQFFLLAALGCATAVTFVVRTQGIMVVVLVTAIIGAAGVVGLGVLRVVRPLLTPQDDRGPAIGNRTRAGLEQEKAATLRTIKELEFDRAMGKLSDADFAEMSTRLRARAARLIHQLDTAEGYRPLIERELAKRLGELGDAPVASTCASCKTVNDRDAKFCKNCGARL
jgi:hypothetical protein